MHSPSINDPAGLLGPDRDLLSDNRKRIRGLSNRWTTLRYLHSLGTEELKRKSDASVQAHRIAFRELIASQQRELEESVTNWDSMLDSLLGEAESHTLDCLSAQKEDLAREKATYKTTRNDELSAHAQAKKKLATRIESAKAQATKSRDNDAAKITRESKSLSQKILETREWIAARTGKLEIGAQPTRVEPLPSQRAAELSSLDGVAKEFERIKQRVVPGIEELQSHRFLRLVSPSLLVVLGLLSGAASAGIALALAAPPLVWIVVAIASAIIVPATVSLSAAPFLSRTLRKHFQPIVELEKEAQAILHHGLALIEQSHGRVQAKLDEEWNSELHSMEEKHRQRLETLDNDYQKTKVKIAEQAVRRRVDLAVHRKQEMAVIDQRESDRMSSEKISQAQTRERIEKQHAKDLESMQQEFNAFLTLATKRLRRGMDRVRDRIQQQKHAAETVYPAWNSPEMNEGNWLRSSNALAWPIGHVGIESLFADDSPTDPQKTLDVTEERIPVLFDLLHHGNLIIDSDVESRSTAQGIARQLLLRAITSLPAGAMHVTVIDPVGLGKDFSWMMHLADIDPHLVNHRAWTKPIHIAQQLELHARHVEDVIQQSLRNRFRTLADYNQQAGPMAIPYRFIIWSGFPFGLDENSWQAICVLLASGARCGVGLILELDEHSKWPAFADPAKLREHGMMIQLRSDPRSVILCNSGFDDSSLELTDVPTETVVHTIMEHHLRAASSIGKRIVPFSSIVPPDAKHFSKSSADGLEIPIGVSESGRAQSLNLGAGTSQHVLIAGKTGSGKSSLLHTMITSGALNYAPDQLRMVLLDFKKGVEFQVYAQEELPHADIIGIESRREFGLSALEYLDRILSARGEAFREWGVQDLPSLKRKFPEVVLPRILIVIDEFQEMFVEDDKLSQQASLLVDRLVRQGRSFGMHLVLASQTLGGSYSLPRTTLAQMAVRIALQCDTSDAMLILSEDNSAAERLRHSGQGIYNDAGGRIEGNHNFQVSFLEKSEQTMWLQTIPRSEYQPNPTINPIGKRIVFEGHKPSRWEHNTIQAVLQTAPASSRTQAPWVLGESVSIEPPVLRSFPPGAGRNAMIVGNDSSLVAGLLASWMRTGYALDPSGESTTRYLILDGSSADDEPMSLVMQWLKKQPHGVKVAGVRELDAVLADVQAEWKTRNADPDRTYPPLILFVANLARFREFRRSDEFSFSSAEDALSPDALLAKLLSDGPNVGIHICIWADTATTLSRWLPRNAMRDIEIRILMQMSASDSNQLIDSSLANKLDRYVLLVHDDSDGKSVKFRPYELQSILQDED